jgi:hypothetical protein
MTIAVARAPSHRSLTAARREEEQMDKATTIKTLRTAGALMLALGLVACGDDDGGITDDPGADMGPMPGVDMGPMPDTDMGGMDPDMFVEPGCEDIACVNGTCDASGAEPVCVCDAGWTGDTCEDLNAPSAADTVLWLDATDSDSFTFDGADVIRWADRSPEEADFVSDAASTRPKYDGVIGTRSAVQFDGVDDVLTSDGYTGLTDELRYTAFFVVSSSADNNILAGYSGANERLRLEDTDSGFGLAYTHTVPADSDAIFSTAEAYTVGDVHLVTVQRTNEETSMWIDGGHRIVLAASTPEAIPSAIDLVLGDDTEDGNTTALSGLVGEIIVFPTNLDLESRRGVESYLAEKWLGGPASHDATSLGNTTWWLDATDEDSVFVPDGETAVAVWSSKIGDSRNFSQEDGDRRPLPIADGINGMPVVRFDGDDDKLTDNNSDMLDANEYTVAVVGRGNNEGNATFLTGVSGTNIRGIAMWGGNGGEEFDFDHTWPASISPNLVTVGGGTTGAPVIAIATWDGVESTLLTNFGSGSAGNTQDPIDSASFVLGSTRPGAGDINPLDGDIGEVIVFERALTDAEQARLLELLRAKWGI